MQLAALLISIMALLVSATAVRRQIRLSRHSNSMPVLVDLFREHRSDYLARARHLVVHELSGDDLRSGLNGLPQDRRLQVRDLLWFYDNLGVFVVHKLIDVPMVAGYLGGSVIDVWEKLMPLIEADRLNRAAAGRADHERWLEYFEYLYNVVVDDKLGNAGAAKVRARIQRQINRANLSRGGKPRRL
ncbi:hypothetical protein [Amycolatopsis sp. lyj-112]|uniref:DUF4760 domain-containing protein n=1 Tax=Amycolatopsis sp. lyj-112 TaxID=2789288 RepID=UPI00397A6509